MENDPLARAKALIAGLSGDETNKSPRVVVGDEEYLPEGSFYVSVIKGSSLVSTKKDLRNVLKGGSVIQIDGKEYTISSRHGAEWSCSRIEISSDFTGETNLRAELIVKDFVRSSPRKKKLNSMEPISSSEIRDAVRALDAIDNTMNTFSRTPVQPPPRRAIDHNRRNSAGGHRRVEQSLGEVETSVAPPPVEQRLRLESEVMGVGSYLASLLQSRSDADAAVEEQRRLAKIRVAQKKREDAKQFMKQAKEEEDRKVASHMHMEMKAKALREKTLLRVTNLQKAKLEEERARKEALDADMKRKAEADALVQSDQYQSRMHQLRLDSKNRMKMLKSKEEELKRERDVQMEKKLFEISEQRRRHDHGPIKKLRQRTIRSGMNRQREEDPCDFDHGLAYSVEQEMDKDLLLGSESADNYYHHDDRIDSRFACLESSRAKHADAERKSKSEDERRLASNAFSSAPAKPHTIYRQVANGDDNKNGRNNYVVDNDDHDHDHDEDDDGFWSNDSLGDDPPYISFNGPNEETTLRQKHEQQIQPQAVRYSYADDDDFTAVSGITVGSPKRVQLISAMPASKPRAAFKPLKPLSIRPFVSIPK